MRQCTSYDSVRLQELGHNHSIEKIVYAPGLLSQLVPKLGAHGHLHSLAHMNHPRGSSDKNTLLTEG